MYHFLRNSFRASALLLVVTAVRGEAQAGYTLLNPTPIAEMRALSTESPSGISSGPVAAPAAKLRPLSTDRPDQTESPYTVDAGHFQFESDLVNYTCDHDRSGGGEVRTTELRLMALNLKVGLSNRVDLQLMIDPSVRLGVTDRGAGTTGRVSGFGDVTTRLKINCWGNDGGPTAFAVMPFVKWPLSASSVRNGKPEGGVIFVLGCALPRGWGSAVMTEVDFVSDGAGGHDTEWLNSITFSHDITGALGGYVEFVAVTGSAPGFKWKGQLDAGLTYALSASTQLDIGCNFGVTKSAPDYQPFAGVSRRF